MFSDISRQYHIRLESQSCSRSKTTTFVILVTEIETIFKGKFQSSLLVVKNFLHHTVLSTYSNSAAVSHESTYFK